MKPTAGGAGLAILRKPKEVEASLWRRLRFEENPACRSALFDAYRDLARAAALAEFRRRPAYGLERGDFEQLAYSGLLEAIDRYDPLRGAPFSAYARLRIRGAISDGLARSSERGAEYAYRRRVELERLQSLQARPEPSEDAVAELADLAVSLAIGFAAEDASLWWAGASHIAPELDAYESVAWREAQLGLLKEIERLPENERTVLQQHYLNDVSFANIAEMLGLTKGRISQLHRSALFRVRERLRARNLEE